MKKDKNKTDVIFRRYKNGQIIALFPYDTNPFDSFVDSYMHLGQHSGADYSGCIKETKLATKKEYQNLFEELESIGYNLNIIKKRMRQ